MKSHENYQTLLSKQLKNFIKQWGIQIAVIFLAVMWLSLIASQWSDAAEDSSDMSWIESHDSNESNSIGEKANDEFSFKWLDPEKKVYVLQNRRYLKTQKLYLSLMGGTGLSSAYRTVYSLDPRVSYYFSEALGLEFFYSKESNTANNNYKALLNSRGTSASNPLSLPVVREIDSYYGMTLQWVPWYAKINVFNVILYFDWYFGGGIGNLHTFAGHQADRSDFATQDLTAAFFQTGHIYHLNKRFHARIDLTGAFYNAPVYGDVGEKVWFSNFNFALGLGVNL